MAYKKLIKVSNVCQLLDKRKFPATMTVNGITFTNNGDGTITVNGTATEDTFMSAGAIGVIKGHKYLWKGTPVGGALSTFHSYITGNVVQFYIDTGSGTISTATDDGVAYAVLARVKFGTTVSNLVFKPQLFDLTEMYGAGHEPTSIEQFRQDFPDEMYDYSPHCWLTSYKRVFMTGGGNYLTSYQRNLTCKTKNLFDINSVSNINNWVPSTTTAHPYGYYTFYLKPNTTYTFSRKYASNNNEVYACFSEKYGVAGGQWFIHPTAPSLTRKQLSFTTNDTGIMYLNVYGVRSVLSSFIELIEGAQLELGDTATDYVPYGHL